MTWSALFVVAAGIGLGGSGVSMADTATLARDYPVQPVPFTAVHVTDQFWAPRIETNRAVTIPYAFQKCEETGRVYNFDRAAAVLRGDPVPDRKPPGFPFDDTDIYKILEGASYALSVQPDPKLKAYLDGLIVKIGAAQEPDGYLYTTRTIDPLHPHPWAGSQRWANEKDLSHELYNLGHLYEAAAAHYQATGERSLLDIAIKSADLLDRTFGPGKQAIWPGHQIVEMGLVKLARATGDERYVRLAQFMIDARGPDGSRGAGRDYNQSKELIRDQTEAVGHAVRATYMYSGVADVAALADNAGFVHAIDAIWDNCVTRKLYITGGIGALHAGEAFGRDYQLPNQSAYNETCAAIGNVYWNQRLFLLHADAKYVDVMERTLYNGLCSGVSLDGRSFFYPNPLESAGDVHRSPWFGCACCPGNITRFMASLPGYVYATRGDDLYVNLFVAGTADIALGGAKLDVVQETNYPWDGRVKLTLKDAAPAGTTVYVRIPGWACGEPVPGDLYRYLDLASEAVTLKVNGRDAPVQTDKGYVALRRAWAAGDTIELNLPMPVRRVLANEHVAADAGRVALERGPVVYCLEGVDHPDGKVRQLALPDASTLTTEARPDLLGGVVLLHGTGKTTDANGLLVERPITAIPYATWDNRGQDEMIVWLPRNIGVARPAVQPRTTATFDVPTPVGP